MKHIYVVISQTNSIVSRLISKLTGDKYSHASISLDKELDTMYSFGRIFPNNPFIGGFVKESPHYGTMKKFGNANIVVIQLEVANDKFDEVNEYIQTMYANRRKFRYNTIGLFLAKFGMHFHRDNHFYCSEFVKALLEKFNLVEKNKFVDPVRPAELLGIDGKVVYCGKLCEYARLTHSTW